MQLKDMIQSLIMNLIEYRGEKTRQARQKDEVARMLLLAIIRANVNIHNNKTCLQEQAALYNNLLHTAQHTLVKLKNNHGGELDSIVQMHIEKLTNNICIEIKQAQCAWLINS